MDAYLLAGSLQIHGVRLIIAQTKIHKTQSMYSAETRCL